MLSRYASKAAVMSFTLRDADGVVALGVDREVTVPVEGPGVLQGFGSAAPASEEGYVEDVHTTFDGRGAVVEDRPGGSRGGAGPGAGDACADLPGAGPAGVDRRGRVVRRPRAAVPQRRAGRAAADGSTRMARSSVRLVLRRAAERAGVPLDGLSSHSLRRSFVTEGYKAGVSERELARTGRWASVTTLRGYDASSRWAAPASARLGL